MSQKRLSMRKITEVLRLRFGLGLGQDQIAQSCSIGQATVHRYLARATAAGLTWPLPEDDILIPAPSPIQFAKTAVSVAARLSLAVLFPQQLQGDMFVLLQLPVNVGEVQTGARR